MGFISQSKRTARFLKPSQTVFRSALLLSLVKRRVDRVEVLLVQLLLRDAQGVGEAIKLKHYCHQSTAMSTVLFHTVIKG